ncbi:MAG: PA2779 family protein [Desulfobacteraceae bacterium]|nr:PA2779 family protein [Desulfobacteraceae bacterium]
MDRLIREGQKEGAMRCFAGVRFVAVIILFAFCASVIPAPALYAAMIETPAVLENDSGDVRAQLDRMFEKKQVREALEARGVSVEEARARVAALTDEQMRQVAQKLDSMPSGQGIGTVVGAALLVFLVLLVTDIAGLTDVFPFVVKNK